MMGAATEKARLPRFSLVLGIESCCEVDDLSCLGMLENCRRLSQVRSLNMCQRALCKTYIEVRDIGRRELEVPKQFRSVFGYFDIMVTPRRIINKTAQLMTKPIHFYIQHIKYVFKIRLNSIHSCGALSIFGAAEDIYLSISTLRGQLPGAVQNGSCTFGV